jgi:hypothetical protein
MVRRELRTGLIEHQLRTFDRTCGLSAHGSLRVDWRHSLGQQFRDDESAVIAPEGPLPRVEDAYGGRGCLPQPTAGTLPNPHPCFSGTVRVEGEGACVPRPRGPPTRTLPSGQISCLAAVRVDDPDVAAIVHELRDSGRAVVQRGLRYPNPSQVLRDIRNPGAVR